MVAVALVAAAAVSATVAVPSESARWTAAARAHLKARALDVAIEDCGRAIAADPGTLDAYLICMRACARSGRDAEAVWCAREALPLAGATATADQLKLALAEADRQGVRPRRPRFRRPTAGIGGTTALDEIVTTIKHTPPEVLIADCTAKLDRCGAPNPCDPATLATLYAMRGFGFARQGKTMIAESDWTRSLEFSADPTLVDRLRKLAAGTPPAVP